MSVDIHKLLAFTMKQGASDLHLSAGMPPLVRIHGEITKIDVPPFTPEDLLIGLHTIMTPDQKALFEENLECDFAIEVPQEGRFRVNCFTQSRGPGAVLRSIPTEVPSLAQLGMPEILGKLAMRERGLILVTGPTGSGKSTTLAAMIHHINENSRGHILTVEDPIEFVHSPKKCLINQREVGRHTHSFAAALRSALREDPDVILVGELRDLETTQLAITAAETGHVVFGTLHTNSAAKTVDRIIDVFPSGQQAQIRTMFSESIMGIVSQVLLKKADGKGRAVAQEILVATSAVRNLIREEKASQIQTVLQTGAAHGMQALDNVLAGLVKAGKVTVEEAASKALDPKTILRLGEGAEKVVDIRNAA
jgi:twitching motility protein PilT